MFPFPANFKTFGGIFLMAHGLRPHNEAQTTELFLCDSRNWLANECVEHGALRSRPSNKVCIAPHTFSTTTKETIFRRNAVSCTVITAHVHQIPPNDAACNLSSLGVWCGVSWMHLGGSDKLWFTSRSETLSTAVLDAH